MPIRALTVPATLLLAIAAHATLSVVPPRAAAAWLANGTPLVVDPPSQESPAITSDGSGGAIVAWRDSRNGSTSDIYAQCITGAGALSWTPNGVVVSAATGTQSSPDILADGSLGAIVAWRDDRNGTGDIYAQRLDALGQTQWVGDVPLATSASNETFPTITSDLASPPGFIVSYFDRPLGQPAVLKVQHVNLAGTGLWAAIGTGGVTVTASIGQKFTYSITTDGVGAAGVAKGAVLAWDEIRPGPAQDDVYVNRVSAAGVMQWGPEGSVICGLPSRQQKPAVANVGADQVMVVWEDTRNTIVDLFAQKLNIVNGTGQWIANGLPVVTTSGADVAPRIVADGVGGALVFWRRGTRVYGQRLNSNGAQQWFADGVALASVDGALEIGDVISDGAGGAIVAWLDTRSGANDVYAQRIDPNGALLWNPAGVAVCTAAGEQAMLGIVSDDANGMIAAWRDQRSGDYDIYANRVFADGVVLDVPLPSDVGGTSPRLALASANPARGEARFRLSLPRATDGAVDVVDVTGRLVRTILAATPLAAGTHHLEWDGMDTSGRPVTPGLYFVRMLADGRAQTKRIVVVW